MDGLRELASAYYEKADTEERLKVIELFNKLDSNGDREISLEEYKGCVGDSCLADRLFGRLDANADGKLEFSDVLVLYYMSNKFSCFRCCDVCEELLVGSFFTCASCFGVGNSSYDLCIECYRKVGDCPPHEHPLSDFTDQLSMFVNSFANQRKRELAELSKIAHAQYQAAPTNIRTLAMEFFNEMDKDGNGKIDLDEFLSSRVVKSWGYTSQFFKLMDIDSSGTLEFGEVVTLTYLIKSGRPFCSMCSLFIPGTFFSCLECYKKPKEGTSSYYLCRGCYFSGKCTHSHEGGQQPRFLDNYMMLELTRCDVKLHYSISNYYNGGL